MLPAQVVIAPPPTVGSSNPVSPEPLVTRPTTTPCKVPLFVNATFNSSSSLTYTYTPPSACPGPWAKVVFSADFTVSKGVQLNRNPEFFIGNATLFRGTTAEPSPSLSPSWHVESDVTDLSALLGATQSVVASCNNVVNSTYTGVIYANAELDFYPTSPSVPAAVVPDQVIPIVQDPTNPVQAFTTSSPLSVTVTMPKNVTQLYLDVISQPDEFWWLSTPNAQVAPYIKKVDATALREMDVSIDGTPAGIAPNHPYIFTDGIDPYLWVPIPGAQTLHLKPYRINLTPFAGALSDGNPHTITINDINTIGSAYLNADLFVYTDHGASTTTGSVLSNSLTTTPPTNVTSTVNLDSNGNGTAEINESLQRTFTISGVVNTSQGAVTTTVKETVNFVNAQQLTNSATENVVLDNLTSTVDASVTTATPARTTIADYHTENPLQVFVTTVQNTDGTSTQTSTAQLNDQYKQNGPASFSSDAEEGVMATDSLILNSSSNPVSHSGQASTGTYLSSDSEGNNYSSTLTASGNVLTGATTSSSSSASTLFISTSATTVVQGAGVVFNATVIPANSTFVPTGYVTFYANGAPLGTATVAGGAAALNVPLPVGTDTITATYTGDADYEAQTSINTLTVTVTPLTPTFTLGAPAPATLSVAQGASGVLSLPVIANGTFTGSVSLSCSGMPAETTCTLNPTPAALVANHTTAVSVVVQTTAPTITSSANRLPAIGGSLGGISIAGIFLLLLPKRRKGWKSLTLSMLAFLGLGLCSVATLTGCGGSAKAPPVPTGTPLGTSTLTVTATSGSITQTATFTLTVTQ